MPDCKHCGLDDEWKDARCKLCYEFRERFGYERTQEAIDNYWNTYGKRKGKKCDFCSGYGANRRIEMHGREWKECDKCSRMFTTEELDKFQAWLRGLLAK